MSDYSEQEQWERVKAMLKAYTVWIVGGLALGVAGLNGWWWYKDRQVQRAEVASGRYQELLDAFARSDRKRGEALSDELKRDYAWTSYAALGTLVVARYQVEANELDKAAASLTNVMQTAQEPELQLIARMRLARVQAAQGKYDDALGTLKVNEIGVFGPRFADVRGDVLLAKGDRTGALREYLAARAADADNQVDKELLDLKIRDLGGTPPATSEES